MTHSTIWVLGIETAGPGTQVALWSPHEEKSVVRRHDGAFEHAEVLHRLVEEVLRESGLVLKEVSALVVSQGPGYFTALRVGISFAKAFALATGRPIKAVPTLWALAHDADCPKEIVIPVLNAQKQQVYVAVYRRERGDLVEVWSPRVMDPQEVVERWQSQAPCVVGQGVATYPHAFQGVQATAEPAYPDPVTLAKLGWRTLQKEGPDDPLRVEPLYVRLPDAVLHARQRQDPNRKA